MLGNLSASDWSMDRRTERISMSLRVRFRSGAAESTSAGEAVVVLEEESVDEERI